ncbi:hypothetical protein HJC23_001411 [Cyclotella cryptica]|uniref:TIGR00297 family protein n=1 Tax=Cyclotella cryptica TaxID=29204 RepID=A0ABD3PE91_9STRA
MTFRIDNMRRILLLANLFTTIIRCTNAFTGPIHHVKVQKYTNSIAAAPVQPTHNNKHVTSLHLLPTAQESVTFVLPSCLTSINTESLIESSSSIATALFQSSGNVALLPSFILNSVLFFLLRSKLITMLTPEGIAHSLALGTMLWATLGWRGWTVCVLYLFLGQIVTKVGFREKEELGIAEKRGGRRGPENVWGSAFTGVLCAAAAANAVKSGVPFLGLSSEVWILGYVASLSTKLADTFASEIGKAYGKTTFLITTLKPVPRGTEGAISLEGTIASVFGGLLLPMYSYFVVGLVNGLDSIAVATLAAFVATMIESLIGATMQEKTGMGWMTNEVVNFFNTLIGASLAIIMGMTLLRI